MITAPGAPITGFAVPASTPPSPSPAHQTPRAQGIEAASATLTAGRQAMPTARNSCTLANAALAQVGWPATRRADQVMGSAMNPGLPAAIPASIWLNPLPNMNDCSCSTASSSQIAASPSWSRRRKLGVAQARGTPLARQLAGHAAALADTLFSLITESPSVPRQAAPFTGACTCSAACTTCGSGASIAVGPPGIGTNQTWIIAGVTLFTDPGGQVDCPGPTAPTTPSDPVRHRLVCTCHCVRQPPGWGAGPLYVVMYIAATSTAPFGVLAYTRDCGS